MQLLVFFVLLLLVAPACSSPLLSIGAAERVALQNRTSSPLLYLAVERELSTRVDPNPSWRVADHLDRLIEPAQTRDVEVQEYQRGDDVRVFLYRVADRSGEAPLVKIMTVTHAQLRRSNYLIVVEE